MGRWCFIDQWGGVRSSCGLASIRRTDHLDRIQRAIIWTSPRLNCNWGTRMFLLCIEGGTTRLTEAQRVQITCSCGGGHGRRG